MIIERVEVRLLALPMTEPFVASHGTSTRRDLTVVYIETDAGAGWGECAALAEPTYSDEFAAGAFGILEEELGPRLVGHDLHAGTVGHRFALVPGNPMAKAAVEMALLDVELRAAGQSLAQWLGATAERVPAGAAVGLAAPDAVAQRVEELALEGFGRVKLKIGPGRAEAVVDAVRARCPHMEIHLDGNGSFGPDHLDRLTALGSSGVRTIEQPFLVTQPALASELVARLGPPEGAGPDPAAAVVADEAAQTTAAIGRLRQAGALTGVSVKPSRLGGLGAARRLHDACVGWQLALTAGGMVESGLGRHALAALAALPGFTLTGDISPARRWLDADPWPDLTMVDGHVLVPTQPGVAPAPDPAAINRYTLKRAEVRA